MFTGIVTDIGTVSAVAERNRVKRMSIDALTAAAGAIVGASIAVSGVCLTVVAVRPKGIGVSFEVEAAPETLAITTVADWQPGTRVNLERSVKAGDELGGHVVLGHVDGVATIMARDPQGDAVRFAFEAPHDLARFIAAKGSVTLDGTSLTVNHVNGDGFDCLIIPHTLAVTTWADRRVGDRINLEVDSLARYTARLIEQR